MICFSIPAEMILRCVIASRKTSTLTNALLYIQFPFILMNDIGVIFAATILTRINECCDANLRRREALSRITVRKKAQERG